MECIRTPKASSQDKFRHFNHTVLPSFFEPPFCQAILKQVERFQFEKSEYTSGCEWTLKAPSLLAKLDYKMNSPEYQSWFKTLADLGPGGIQFQGRIYKMDATSEDFQLDWHSDLFENRNRYIGVSINLSPTLYQGGRFQIRGLGQKKHLSVHNKGLGDALIFRVNDMIEHRLTCVQGSESKIAYVGWYTMSTRQVLNERPLFGQVP